MTGTKKKVQISEKNGIVPPLVESAKSFVLSGSLTYGIYTTYSMLGEFSVHPPLSLEGGRSLEIW